MSLMRLTRRPNTIVSFAEMILYFCVITPAVLLGGAMLICHLTGGDCRPAMTLSVPAWGSFLTHVLGSAPIWTSLLLGVGYTALLMVYWAPGDQRQNDVELLAFALFSAAVLAVVGIAMRGSVAEIGRLLAEVFRV